MTLLFETKKFRVQIAGKGAWVETREGGGWVFRSQHNLPVTLSIVRGRNRLSLLRAAVEHYERVNDGDQALRAALTGVGVEQKRNVSVVGKRAGAYSETKKSVKLVQAREDVLPGARGPLRPPSREWEVVCRNESSKSSQTCGNQTWRLKHVTWTVLVRCPEAAQESH